MTDWREPTSEEKHDVSHDVVGAYYIGSLSDIRFDFCYAEVDVECADDRISDFSTKSTWYLKATYDKIVLGEEFASKKKIGPLIEKVQELTSENYKLKSSKAFAYARTILEGLKVHQ